MLNLGNLKSDKKEHFIADNDCEKDVTYNHDDNSMWGRNPDEPINRIASEEIDNFPTKKSRLHQYCMKLVREYGNFGFEVSRTGKKIKKTPSKNKKRIKVN